MHNLTKITYNQYCPYNLPNEKYIAVQKTKVQLWKLPQVKTLNKTEVYFKTELEPVGIQNKRSWEKLKVN